MRPGDKFYYLNGSRNLLAGVVGEKTDQFTVIGTHMDFPHIDLKPHFLVEQKDQGTCALLTHYYGGIKKYLFATTPLVMRVSVCKEGKLQTF